MENFFLIVLNCYITLYIYIYKKSCLNLSFLLTFNLNSLIWCLELFMPYNTYNVYSTRFAAEIQCPNKK